jgi:uncharacterized protein YcaQ
MSHLMISPQTRRRFIMGLQGLYPGRRWTGKAGIATAIETMGGLQIDPLNIVARSHEITLWGRVADFRLGELEAVCYGERRFFDYGGTLVLRPMAELPYWRLVMERRRTTPRYRQLVAEHPTILDEVLAYIQSHGATTNRDLDNGAKHSTTGYRTTKATGQALYHLWLTGELMTVRRQGNFERVYDLLERVAPAEYQHTVSVEETEEYFARKVLVSLGMATPKGWRDGWLGLIGRPVPQAEGAERLKALEEAGEVISVQVEGEKGMYYVRGVDYPLLETLHQGAIPAEWQSLDSTTDEEMVFLAPLDMVSARGRAKVLFDFEYIWEVYKPVEKRQFGYYTLPILYEDRLVGRLDPKLERATNTLQILGLWWEQGVNPNAPRVKAAFERGLERFGRFLGADRVVFL